MTIDHRKGPLFGRAAELERLHEFEARGHGALAITGPGGSGKTRLAQELSGIMVDLDGHTEPDAVLLAVSQALGVTRTGTNDLEALVPALASDGRPLILDGCENVLEHAMEAARRLGESSFVVLTSRIRPEGIDVLPLDSLDLPLSDTLDDVMRSSAGRCFAHRARQVRMNWAPEPHEGPILAELLRRLDGLPLALELAASRLDMLGTAQLLEHLEQRFRLLSGLDAVIQASWDLLSAEDRRLLAAMSHYKGGFSLEAAESVVGDRFGTLDRLKSLMDHSLIRSQQVDRLPGVYWYFVYNNVKAFAAGRGGPGDPSWLAERATSLRREAQGGKDPASGERLALWRRDLKSAFDAAVETGDSTVAGQMALALDFVLKFRGPHGERHPIATVAMAMEGPYQDEIWLFSQAHRIIPMDRPGLEALIARGGPLTAHAWRILAQSYLGDDPGRALECCKEAIALDPREVRNYATLFDANLAGGNRGEAQDAVQTAVRLASTQGLSRYHGVMLSSQAMLTIELGSTAEGIAQAWEAVGLLESVGDDRNAALTVLLLTERMLASGSDTSVVRSAANEAIDRHANIHERRTRSYGLALRALCDQLDGEIESANQGMEAALEYARLYDSRTFHSAVCAMATIQAALTGRVDRALALLEEGERQKVASTEHALRVARGAWTVATAKELRDAGETREAQELEGPIQALLASDTTRWDASGRAAASVLARGLGWDVTAEVADIVCAADGDWFEIAGQRTDLGTRHANRRIFIAFIKRHLDRPGHTLTADELLAAGWPGERVMQEAGASRVYTAIATLRRWGLRPFIERAEEGYRLKTDTVVLVHG